MRSGLAGLLLGCLLAVGTGCGSDEEPEPPPAEPRVDELAQAVCELMFRCCIRGELDYFLGPFVTADNCAERLVEATRQAPGVDLNEVLGAEDALGIRFPLPNLAALERATAESRGRLDRDSVQACVEFLEQVECNQAPPEEAEEALCSIEVVPPPPATPCDSDRLFIGQAREGESCTSADAELPPCGPGQSSEHGTCRSSIAESLECASGLVCRRSAEYGVAGECVLPGQADDPCQTDPDCASGLYCSLLYGTCQRYRQVGQVCAYSDRDTLDPDPETYLVKCEPGLHCDTLTDICVPPCQRGAQCAANLDEQCNAGFNLHCVAGRCDFLRVEDLPCAEDADCVAGLWCGQDPDDAIQPDTVCRRPLDETWPCPRHAACISGFCSPAGRCAAPGAPGDPCPSRQDEQCQDGFCVTGDSCVDSTECPPGIACNTTSGTCGPYCEALRAVDRWCSEDRQCQTGACVAHACQVLPRAVGDECDVGEDDECESGFCNPGESPPVCAELPLELGAACALDAHCDSLVCYYDPDTDESTCHTGLGLGADCSHAQAPPCNPKVAYCDLWDSPTPRCALLRETGAECEVAQQCRGQCEIRHGRWMCTDVAPEDAAVCDGAE